MMKVKENIECKFLISKAGALRLRRRSGTLRRAMGYSSLLGSKKPEKIQKEFDEYVNCPELTCSDYVTNTTEDLIKLVNDYVEKCK